MSEFLQNDDGSKRAGATRRGRHNEFTNAEQFQLNRYIDADINSEETVHHPA
jgi:hypothetical protein